MMLRPCRMTLLGLALTASLAAQHRPNVEVQKEAMKKLEFLVGKWAGDASVTMGPGGPVKVRQTEDVQMKLDGLVLLVEGTGRDPQSGKVLFSAVATIAFDEAAKTYRLRAYNNGNYLDTELKLREKGFEWGYSAGPAVVKNVMDLNDKGEWVEVTEVVVNNGPPRRTVEMRVSK